MSTPVGSAVQQLLFAYSTSVIGMLCRGVVPRALPEPSDYTKLNTSNFVELISAGGVVDLPLLFNERLKALHKYLAESSAAPLLPHCSIGLDVLDACQYVGPSTLLYMATSILKSKPSEFEINI